MPLRKVHDMCVSTLGPATSLLATRAHPFSISARVCITATVGPSRFLGAQMNREQLRQSHLRELPATFRMSSYVLRLDVLSGVYAAKHIGEGAVCSE